MNKYICYSNENREKFKKMYPNSSATEVTKMISKNWIDMQNDLDKQDEVEKYVQMAKEEQRKYQELMKGKTLQDEPTSKKQGPINGFQIYWKNIKENYTEEEQIQLKEEMNEQNLFKAARKK